MSRRDRPDRRAPRRRALVALVAGALLAGACVTGERPPEPVPEEGTAPPAALEPEGPPTWARDIAPLVYRDCAPCHHEGGPGPFPLMSYREVKRRARQIDIVTQTGFMPPWKPAPGEFRFDDVRRLGEDEIRMITDWVDAGAPRGDAAEEPPEPHFSGAWLLGEPDAVLEMPETYVLQAEGLDVYRSFVIPSGFEEERYVRAFDFQPDNPRVVHHIITLLDSSGRARAAEDEDPEVGYEGMVAEGELFGSEVHGWGQGATARFLPEGSAWTVPAGADFVLDTHFQTTGRPEPVKIAIGVYFADAPPEKPMTNLSIAGPMICIPPGADEYVVRQPFHVPTDIDAVSIQPHGHYVGKDFRITAHLPGGEQLELIRISDWDFNWQDSYRYVDPVPLPAGTTIWMDFLFDNSAKNDRNPFSPPRRILSGPRSTDEMALLWLQAAVDEEDMPAVKAAIREHHDTNQEACMTLDALFRGIVYGFDANQDGMLDADEDALATAYVNGLIDNEQHAIAFDFDGDGELNDEERDYIRTITRYWNGEPMPPTVE